MQEARDLLTIALFEYARAMWPRYPADAWQVAKMRILGHDVPNDLLTDDQLFKLHEALLSHKKTLEARRAVWAASEARKEVK